MSKTELSKNILKLRSEGKTYPEIVKELNCSKGTISYHCGKDQKAKTRERTRKIRANNHPFQRKLESFQCKKHNPIIKKNRYNSKQKLLKKIYSFHNKGKNMNIAKNKHTFDIDDILNKFGETPTCYLTGTIIDIYDTKSYHFDHIIPVSKGGQNTIENLGICTKQANQAKGDMTPDEFINLCRLVVKIKDQ